MKLLHGNIFRYKFLSLFIAILLIFDLVCNSVFLIFFHNNLFTLLIYIMQNISLVFTFILVAFGIFSTTAAQTGFLGELLRRFRWTILTSVIYFALSFSFHWWSLNKKWKDKDKLFWTDGAITFFTIQRLAGMVYYYLIKRTTLRLSDADLYKNKKESEPEDK